MSTAQKNYRKIHALSKHIHDLKGILSLLGWDQETMMPPEGAAIRGEHVKVMAGLVHKEITGKKFSRALSKLIDLDTGKIASKELDPRQKCALKAWRRDVRLAKSLNTAFVEKFAKLTSQAYHAWEHAKKNDDFKCFSPYLAKIVDMCREKADLIGYNNHPYDALLMEYEPGVKTKDLKKIFCEVREETVKLLKYIAKKKQVRDDFLYGNFSEQKQIEFSKRILADIGYDMRKGRLDQAVHPFSSSCHPCDSRIATRIELDYPISNIRSVLHEGGHSLYEMGIPVQEYGSPLGESASFGIHESQSRWWETRIGNTQGYWKYYLPILRKVFPKKFDAITLDDFYLAVNKCVPSLTRVEADEVTYNLHVILRFEMETGLIEGKINVKEIPEIWNAKTVELLGMTPPNNTKGCLQDVHWSLGYFGYFPSYSLGNLFSAQLFESFESDHPDWEDRVGNGDLLFITRWLQSRIHQYGKQFDSLDLIKHATGKPFSEEPFIRYINKKYREIYK